MTIIFAISLIAGILIFALLNFRTYEFETIVPYEYRLCADEAFGMDDVDVASDYIESFVKIHKNEITITDYYSNKCKYGVVIRHGKINMNRAVFEDCDFPDLFMDMDERGDIKCSANGKPFMIFYCR